jgi:hypothetical protein
MEFGDAHAVAALLPRPALRGERVGVRGWLNKRRTRGEAPTPPNPPK